MEMAKLRDATFGLLREPSDPLEAIRHYLRIGLTLAAVLFFGIGGWATFTQISGAVIAPGHFVVVSSVKKIQHPTGGVISEIDVTEGQAVKAGEVLARLDPTTTRASLTIVENALDQLSIRRARLEAERDGRSEMATPSRLQDRLFDKAANGAPAAAPTGANRAVFELVMSERRLFELRTQARDSQRQQLQERISQLEQEIAGQQVQQKAKEQEIALIDSELKGVRDLYKKNLVPVTRVNALDREAARLQGELGQLIAGTSSARGRINEIRVQMLQQEQQFRSDVAKELREIQDKTAEYVEQQTAAEDKLRRIDIRAPQDGVVHDLSVFTIGGVINPAETLMTIVPVRDELAIEIRVPPQEISHVHPGQPVIVRISAFNQRTTPEVDAEIDRIGADLTTDQRSGQSYYTARIRLIPGSVERLDGKALVPGMPVEAFIQTGDRSVLSYLTRPLTDQMRRAFRES